MKMAALLGVVCVTLLPPHASLAATTNMKEGNWELVTTIKSKGMPFPIPPMKLTHCYTQKDLKDRQSPMVKLGRENECSVADHNVNGNRTTWSMTCKDGSKGTGQAFYDVNSFASTTTFVDERGGETTTSTNGRRLGDCK